MEIRGWLILPCGVLHELFNKIIVLFQNKVVYLLVQSKTIV